MRPVIGVALEALILAAVIGSGRLVSPGPEFAVYVLASEFLATYLVHCPAHYAVGAIVGIRFRRIAFSRTTLARSVPRGFAPLVRLLTVPTLYTDRSTLRRASRAGAAAMYASGAVASVAAGFAIALEVTLSGETIAAALGWAFAVGYLIFDVKFSHLSGDLMRARAAASL